MLKSKKSILAVLVAVVMVLGAVPLYSAVSDYYSDRDDEFMYLFSVNRARAMKNLDNLDMLFAQNSTRSAVGATNYPDNFGGVYLDYYGNLVVLEVQRNATLRGEAVISDIASALCESSVTIREVKFSYNELMALFDYLRDFVSTYRDNPGAALVTSISFGMRENRIIVGLSDYNEYNLNLFKNTVINSPLVIFQFSPAMTLLSPPEAEMIETDYLFDENISLARGAVITPFSQINIRRGNLRANLSVSFRATMDGRSGFITAAHAFWESGGLLPGEIVFQGNQQIGVVTRARLHNVDAAFVELTNGARFQPDGDAHVQARSLVGDRIRTYSHNSPVRTGTILYHRNWFLFIGDIFLMEAFIVSHTAIGGNSGGLVLHDTWGNNDYVVGMLVGRYGSRAIVVPSSAIQWYLGVNMY